MLILATISKWLCQNVTDFSQAYVLRNFLSGSLPQQPNPVIRFFSLLQCSNSLCTRTRCKIYLGSISPSDFLNHISPWMLPQQSSEDRSLSSPYPLLCPSRLCIRGRVMRQWWGWLPPSLFGRPAAATPLIVNLWPNCDAEEGRGQKTITRV